MSGQIKKNPASVGALSRISEDTFLVDTGTRSILGEQVKRKLLAELHVVEILEREAYAVATATDDERSVTFAKAAFKLARLVAEGLLTKDRVEWHLQCAAHVAEMHNFLSIINAAFVESTRPQVHGGRSDG